MVHAKHYETVSTSVKVTVCRENCGFFFPDAVYFVLL